MSQLLIQKQLTAAQILRTHGKQFKQIKRHYSDERDGRCTIGVLYSYFGWNGKLDTGFGHDQTLIDADHKLHELLHHKLWYTIYEMNDSGKSFDEIADWLDSKNSCS